LTIRDNAEVFDSLFQLYQKGSLPVDIIYELFNLNSDEIDTKLYDDLFTVKDSTFNRLIEEVSGEVGRALVERTDVAEKIASYLKLDYQQAPAEDEEGFGGGFEGGFGDEESGGFGDEETPAPDEGAAPSLSEADQESFAEGVAEGLPEGASDEEIVHAVEEAEAARGE